MTSSSLGAKRERELVNRFGANGWGALRLPSSGSATERELPDVLAGRPTGPKGFTGQIYTDAVAIELKSGAQTTLYVDEQEAADLQAFAERWGATPYLGARFTFDSGEHYSLTETYLVEPDDARRTEGGAYGLPVDDIDERASVVVTADAVERLAD